MIVTIGDPSIRKKISTILCMAVREA